jgi:molybdate transport system substrate-binding protein
MRLLTFVTTFTLLAITVTADAQTVAPLRVLASNGLKAVIDELQPRLERELGRPLAIQFNTSTAIQQSIEGGDAFDATVLTSEVLSELAKSGRIVPSSVTDLGRSGIGFGVKSGTSKPDVRTAEAAKKALLNAKSLTWVSGGASRVHIDRMLDALGIASDVKSKTVLTRTVDESVALVAEGKNEMVLSLTSEVMPAKGVAYVGPLPAEFQNYVSFQAGVNPKASAPAAAALFIKLLAAPAAAAAYKAKGMEPQAQTQPQSRGRGRPIK